jgi:LuxR family maltose regulon positive regulatory protein
MMETRLLQALATASSTEALQFLREALKMAQPEGFIRTFLDMGKPMKLLLKRLKPEGGELNDYVLTLLSAFGESAGVSKDQPLVEPMSERELEVLRLLADGLSNCEITERLVITVGTAKSHVHHILEKMGTESRMQAAAKARELGLV